MNKFVCQWFDLEQRVFFDFTIHDSLEECKEIAKEGVSSYMKYKGLDSFEKTDEKFFVLNILQYENNELVGQGTHCVSDGWKWYYPNPNWPKNFPNLLVFPPTL